MQAGNGGGGRKGGGDGGEVRRAGREIVCWSSPKEGW